MTAQLRTREIPEATPYLPEGLRQANEGWPEATPVLQRSRLPEIVANLHAPRRSRVALAIKRCIDILGASLGLVVLAPLFLALMVVVRVSSRGPAFYVQNRVGRNGRVFRFYKFRTMVVDADRRKAELSHLNEMKGPVFKIRKDPRITRAGAWLRKLSLDELPQLVNVLKGDMSLVGPRPPVPNEVEHYTRYQAQRLCVTPGLTGLWQVSGRNLIDDFDQWIELDLRYVNEWSLWLDLKILAKTPYVVIAGRGAS